MLNLYYSDGSDQPAHSHILIRVFAVRLTSGTLLPTVCHRDVLGFANMQADLSIL